MRIKTAILFYIILVTTFFCSVQLLAMEKKSDRPPLPYYDYLACPFEGCTYREWTALADIIVHKDHDDSSLVITSIKNGETMLGLSGVVITTIPGEVLIKESRFVVPIAKEWVKDGDYYLENSKEKILLKSGDIVYFLHSVGEGFGRYWFKGQIIIDEIESYKKKNSWVELKRGSNVWWAKVKMRDGRIGWINMGKFASLIGHKDRYE